MTTEAEIIERITALPHVHVVTSGGNHFFFYAPTGEGDNKFPFATLMLNDDNDNASDLARPGVCRLNIGVSKATFLSLFGAPVSRPGEDGLISSGFDYTQLDQLMPHPVYGNLFWVCVLNPGAATAEKVQALLSEAYRATVSKKSKPANTD